MRKRFIGHIGDASFDEALRFLEGGGRGTLFAVSPLRSGDKDGGLSEKVLHFAESSIARMPFRPHPAAAETSAASGPVASDPAAILQSVHASRAEYGVNGAAKSAAPSSDPEYMKAAKAFLKSELDEVLSWRGAPFELREGPLAQSVEGWAGSLRIHAPAAVLLEGLRGKPASRAASGAPAATVFAGDAAARVETLGSIPPPVLAGQLIPLELAKAWRELGVVHRAADCLREAARHYMEWGADEPAAAALEEALSICPVDSRAAAALLSMHQSAGKHKQAEAVAESIGSILEKWKLHDLLVQLYKSLDRAPESAFFRRVGAEALIRTGDLLHGLRELAAVAVSHEGRGERHQALRIYERMLEIDPSCQVAKMKLERILRFRALCGWIGRWGGLAAGIVLAGVWLLWDSTSASALEKGRDSPPSDLRREVDVLKTEASRYPASRHASRIASREEDLYRKSFIEDRKLLLDAIEAESAGDTGTAFHLYGNVLRRTLLPAFSRRADLGRAAISRLDSRRADLLQHATRLIQGRDYAAAFSAFSEILNGAQRSVVASSYLVPILIETVPEGASIEVDGLHAGRTPRWLCISSDPETSLRLSLEGFGPIERRDPLGPALQAKSPRLFQPLVPEAVWAAESWGGALAEGAPPGSTSLPVLGADGVLRAIDTRIRRPGWERPLDARARASGAPLIAGPIVLLGTSDGQVIGYARANGRPAWVASLGSSGRVSLGPIVEGQVVACCEGRAVLLNPETGLVARRLRAPVEGGIAGFTAWEDGGFGIVATGAGALIRVRLRKGEQAVAREGIPEGIRGILRAGEELVAIGRKGTLAGFGRGADPKLWETRLWSAYSLACEGGPARVVLGSPEGSLICLDARAGTPVWKTAVEGKLTALSSGGGAGGVIFATLEREAPEGVILAALGAGDGSIRWEVRVAERRGELASVRFTGGLVAVSSPSLGIRILKAPGR